MPKISVAFVNVQTVCLEALAASGMSSAASLWFYPYPSAFYNVRCSQVGIFYFGGNEMLTMSSILDCCWSYTKPLGCGLKVQLLMLCLWWTFWTAPCEDALAVLYWDSGVVWGEYCLHQKIPLWNRSRLLVVGDWSRKLLLGHSTSH